MEIKIVPQPNNKFNIMLINTTQCFVVGKTENVDYDKVGEETQKLMRKYF